MNNTREEKFITKGSISVDEYEYITGEAYSGGGAE